MNSSRTLNGKIAAPHAMTHQESVGVNVVPWVICFLFILTLVAIFHVWSRCRVIDLNLSISGLSRQLKELRQEQSRLRVEAASLKSPARVETLARTQLGMTLPTEQNVVMVK